MEIIAATIEALKEQHWPMVKAIYEEGIATGNATFQTAAPATWHMWDHAHLQHSKFVAMVSGEVAGWVALSPTSQRPCYRGVSEVSVYISASMRGKGVGTALMAAMVTSSEEHGIWSLYASTFRENEASIHLHKKFGFRTIGYRERVAEKHGVWRDTVLLERRSRLVGC